MQGVDSQTADRDRERPARGLGGAVRIEGPARPLADAARSPPGTASAISGRLVPRPSDAVLTRHSGHVYGLLMTVDGGHAV